jgi:uncharacterized protein
MIRVKNRLYLRGQLTIKVKGDLRMKDLTKQLIPYLTFFFASFVFAAPAIAQESATLPPTMIWTSYDVGTTAYTQPSAIAAMLSKKYPVKIRVLPSSTGIGRLIPIKTKKAQCAFLGNEAYFSAEGLYDFAVYEWGPQDLRVVLGRPNTVTFVCTRDSGIKTLSDLRGKRVSYVPGAPSLNVKTEAMLAFAGLTWDDVKKTEFSTWTAQMNALIEGKTDASTCTTDSAFLHQIETSHRGLYRPPLPPNDKEGWKRLQKIAPFLSPEKATIGAGLSEENPINAAGYRFPILTVYADEDPEFVYNLIKAIDESYPQYKTVHPAMPSWKIDCAGIPPADAPFHEGAIKYLKEKGVWKAQHDAWNKERISHMQKVQKAWQTTLDKAQSKELKAKDFPNFWLNERKSALEN